MLTKEEYEKYKRKTIEYINAAKIPITENEKNNIQVAEYGLNCIDQIGLELIEYVNTERCCAKQLVLLPNQTCPEHRHPPVFGEEGKEETFRCCYGRVYLYVHGESTDKIKAILPKEYEKYFTCKQQIILNPGEQFTIMPNTLHWFQAGSEGAVIWEFSTKSCDESDIYTDPNINPTEKRSI